MAATDAEIAADDDAGDGGHHRGDHPGQGEHARHVDAHRVGGGLVGGGRAQRDAAAPEAEHSSTPAISTRRQGNPRRSWATPSPRRPAPGREGMKSGRRNWSALQISSTTPTRYRPQADRDHEHRDRGSPSMGRIMSALDHRAEDAAADHGGECRARSAAPSFDAKAKKTGRRPSSASRRSPGSPRASPCRPARRRAPPAHTGRRWPRPEADFEQHQPVEAVHAATRASRSVRRSSSTLPEPR
jgi:hypothetical protein